MDDGRVVAQPFVTASVFHEFAGNTTTDVTARIDQTSLPPQVFSNSTGTLTSGRIGTYAQIGIGSAVQLVNTGWLGYIRADFKTGENIEGMSLNAGLRYQLNSDAGGFKDGGSLKDGPAPYYNWTGLYFGPSAGMVAGNEFWKYLSYGTQTDPDLAGYLLGGQAGYNYQFGPWVAGVEGELFHSNARGAASCPNGFFWSCEANLDTIGTATARLGYTWGRALFYAKGGAAFGESTVSTHSNDGRRVNGSTTKWQTGWTAGAGAEIALTDRWSAKAEYMRYDLGRETFTVDHGLQVDVPTAGDSVRIGLNYHLGRGLETGPLK
jgi:opacity protein-like surface antigen